MADVADPVSFKLASSMAAGTERGALNRRRSCFTADMLTLVITNAAAPILTAP
ncbi:MAG: hypothetical protein WAO83_05365 [Fuerstiella sp.]